MLSQVSRVLLTIGTALLLLAVMTRLLDPSGPNAVGADLAILASAALVLVTGLYPAFQRHRTRRN